MCDRPAARLRGRPSGGTMRVALFVTCVNDLLYPDTGRAVVTAAGTAGGRGGLPAGPDLLRPAAVQHRLPARDRAAGPPVRRRSSTATTTWSRRPGRARRWCATTTRGSPSGPRPRGATSGLAEAAAAAVPKTYELTEFLVDVLGVTDVGRVLPAHRHLPPLLPRAADARARRAAPAAAGGRAGPGTAGVATAREECCGFGGTFAVKNPDVSAAMGEDKVGHAAGHAAPTCCAGRTTPA